jgi:hypothetical protein
LSADYALFELDRGKTSRPPKNALTTLLDY